MALPARSSSGPALGPASRANCRGFNPRSGANDARGLSAYWDGGGAGDNGNLGLLSAYRCVWNLAHSCAGDRLPNCCDVWRGGGDVTGFGLGICLGFDVLALRVSSDGNVHRLALDDSGGWGVNTARCAEFSGARGIAFAIPLVSSTTWEGEGGGCCEEREEDGGEHIDFLVKAVWNDWCDITTVIWARSVKKMVESILTF